MEIALVLGRVSLWQPLLHALLGAAFVIGLYFAYSMPSCSKCQRRLSGKFMSARESTWNCVHCGTRLLLKTKHPGIKGATIIGLVAVEYFGRQAIGVRAGSSFVPAFWYLAGALAPLPHLPNYTTPCVDPQSDPSTDSDSHND